MAATDQQVQPAANRIMAAAKAGAPQPGPISAQVQVLYDQSYGPCMTARGNVLAASGSGQGRDTVAGNVTYTGLTDPDSIAARQTLASGIEGFRRACEGERIEVATYEAVLSETSNARTISLTTPGGGFCFGQPGQNTYLAARAEHLPGGQGRRRLAHAARGGAGINRDLRHEAQRLWRHRGALARAVRLLLPVERHPLRAGLSTRLRDRCPANSIHPVPSHPAELTGRGPSRLNLLGDPTPARVGPDAAGEAGYPAR